MATQASRRTFSGIPREILANIPVSKLGERVRELRLKLGRSQQDIADICGLNQPWVGQIESGRISLPEKERLYALAQALETDTQDLLIAAGYVQVPDIWKNIDAQLLAEARKASPANQKVAVQFLREARRASETNSS